VIPDAENGTSDISDFDGLPPSRFPRPRDVPFPASMRINGKQFPDFVGLDVEGIEAAFGE
jgi:hypothetical protein